MLDYVTRMEIYHSEKVGTMQTKRRNVILDTSYCNSHTNHLFTVERRLRNQRDIRNNQPLISTTYFQGGTPRGAGIEDDHIPFKNRGKAGILTHMYTTHTYTHAHHAYIHTRTPRIHTHTHTTHTCTHAHHAYIHTCTPCIHTHSTTLQTYRHHACTPHIHTHMCKGTSWGDAWFSLSGG